VYTVFKRLGNGDFTHVAHCDELDYAAQLIEDLHKYWPGEYVVRDSEGNDVCCREAILTLGLSLVRKSR
jgi:hypothetical protein